VAPGVTKIYDHLLTTIRGFGTLTEAAQKTPSISTTSPSSADLYLRKTYINVVVSFGPPIPT